MISEAKRKYLKEYRQRPEAKAKNRERRRRDYARLKLLKGEKPRLVFRRTNRYILAQYISSKEAQDKIEFTITSKIPGSTLPR